MKTYIAEITFSTAFGETATELKSLLEEECIILEFDNVKVIVKKVKEKKCLKQQERRK